ncbi:threonine ammonia-lyase [Amycolatopsis pithecellobii]|uniref:threonine ammonia-lyase n=1 Tax=Amycolatopsis pithecellobii TaxID=664692 RepID=UPI0014096546|nr:pyridoxal-phosphate dependent enzyme [Amycolatopsis pithecellobii]
MTEPAALARADIDRAQRQLAGHVVRTPVIRNDELDRLAHARVWLKAECLQRGGSFKIRGALLAVRELAAAGSRGVVAQSTGNHAIAVALAARECGLPAVLVLPTDAVPAKIRRIEQAGAVVVQTGTVLADRMSEVDRIRNRRGYDVVDPYENPVVVAGQGTATAELISQVESAGSALDAVVLPVGGGSAIAGASLAAEGSDLAVVAAEPVAVPSLSSALHAGRPVTVTPQATVADGLRPDRIGLLPFSIIRDRVHTVVTVDEAAITSAMCAVLYRSRLLVEPAAATALAAALRVVEDSAGKVRDIGVLLSGGNVEHGLVQSVLADYDDRPAGPSSAPGDRS